MKSYKQVKAGEWVAPRMSGYNMACCDCSLVHRLEFRIVGKNVQFRAYRNEFATKVLRKRDGVTIRKTPE